MVSAWIYDFDEFDCEVLFPDINDLKMDGDVVLLPMHLISHLFGNIEDSSEIGFVVDSLAGETEIPDSQNEHSLSIFHLACVTKHNIVCLFHLACLTYPKIS